MDLATAILNALTAVANLHASENAVIPSIQDPAQQKQYVDNLMTLQQPRVDFIKWGMNLVQKLHPAS